MKHFSLAPLFALLCGCATDLKVTPIARGSGAPVVGIGYTLPFTQYAITTKWTVTACDPSLEATSEVNATPGSAEDGDHAYSIDPQSLQTATSVASLKIAYQEKTNLIDTINASAEDQSATVITNVITGAAKLALAAFFPSPPLPGALAATPEAPTCSEDSKAQIAKVEALTPKLKALNVRVEQATDDVTQLAAKVAAMGAALDDATKDALSKAIDNLNDLTSQQADLAKALSKAQEPLTYSITTYWPQDSATFGVSAGPSLPLTVIKKWTGRNDIQKLEGASIYFAIEKMGTFGPTTPGKVGEPPESSKGLRYRMPAQGRLLVCNAESCASNNPEIILAHAEGRISQLGNIGVLPVHTRPFGSTSFAATFDSAGGLKTAGYEQKAAPAVVASGAFSSAATELAPIAAALAPGGRLKRETAALELAKKRQDALTALMDDPNRAKKDAAAALGADTALLQADISYRQAKATLDALAAAQAH